MKISVIIPVLNGIRFVEKAIQSCLIQPEVAEVIVVDDGSTDGTLDFCKKWALRDMRIKVHYHNENLNLGPSASRNVGIRKATSDYIAFLDADDYYLPNRFQQATKIIEHDPNLMGTYGWTVNMKDGQPHSFHNEIIIGIQEPVMPDQLFTYVMSDIKPFFHINSLVLKKSFLIENNICFDTHLKTTEDIDFIYQVVEIGKLVVENDDNKPMIVRQIHDANTSQDIVLNRYTRNLLVVKWFNKMVQKNYPKAVNRALVRRSVAHRYVASHSKDLPLMFRIFYKSIIALQLFLKYPTLIFKIV